MNNFQTVDLIFNSNARTYVQTVIWEVIFLGKIHIHTSFVCEGDLEALPMKLFHKPHKKISLAILYLYFTGNALEVSNLNLAVFETQSFVKTG